jgi:TRAP-type uncharacterized transport system fused permease subunit
VALAALAASSICGAGHLQVGWIATRIALAGYVVPFMAVYNPALMLQEGDPLDVATMIGKAIIAIVLWGSASIGYFRAPLIMAERVAAAAGAFLLVVAVPVTDQLGLAVGAGFVIWQWLRRRRAAVTP